MRRSDFLGALAGAVFARQNPAEVTLEIAAVSIELARVHLHRQSFELTKVEELRRQACAKM